MPGHNEVGLKLKKKQNHHGPVHSLISLPLFICILCHSSLSPTPIQIQRRSYGSGYIAPSSEIIIPNPKRRLALFRDSLPLPQLIPHNASDESDGTSMCSHKSSIHDPHRPSTYPLRLNDI